MQADRQRGHAKGPTGTTLGARVRATRNARNLDLAGLSRELGRIGWPVSVTALSRLENGDRRVDVDDLMALAVALNVSPLSLLLPSADRDDPSPTGVPANLHVDELWEWARGGSNLTLDARLDYWHSEIAKLETEIAQLNRMKGEEHDQARAWARRNLIQAEGRVSIARHRLAELEKERVDGER